MASAGSEARKSRRGIDEVMPRILGHKRSSSVVIVCVSAETDATIRAEAPAETFDFEAIFHSHYRRIARVILRVIQDPSRAEELAVEVFWKLWRHPSAHGPHCAGWLYRTASRAAVDELRKRTRREKYERWFGFTRPPSGDPERSREAAEERTRIRTVLASLRSQDAQLVALRSEGLSYEELADALSLKPTSIGTMLRRAQDAFRKEYTKRYGEA
jgi:RNA polymerase sigma-70 factor, ECF subfamily